MPIKVKCLLKDTKQKSQKRINMKHLSSLKNPADVLNGNIKISQKIDGSSIIIKKENGKIKFFNRGCAAEIDEVKQATSNMYNEAIEHFKSIKLIPLQDGDELHFEYFPSNINPVIPIMTRPKNNLVLLFQKTNAKNFNDKEMSKVLKVSPPPVIFEGVLNNKQKDALLSKHFDASEIKKLNPKFKMYINDEVSEGVVVTTENGENYKVTDVNFTNQIMKKLEKAKASDDSYHHSIMNIVHIFEIDIPPTYKYSPLNYLDLMLKTIERKQEQIISKYKDLYEEKYDNGKPYQVTFSDINWSVFPSSLQQNMRKYPWFKDFVRQSINMHTKIKKRTTPGMNKEQMEMLNKKIHILLKESKRSFYKYLKESDENKDVVGIYIGRFQPLHKSHLQIIKTMSQKYNESYVYVVRGGKTGLDLDKNPFSEQTQMKMLEMASPEGVHVGVMPSADIYKFFLLPLLAKRSVKEVVLFCGPDRERQYMAFAKYFEKEGVSLKVHVLNFDRDNVSGTSVRQSLKSGNFESYKKMMPEQLWSIFPALRYELTKGKV